MEDKSLTKVGGICSILVGISYIVVGITFLLLPAVQRPGGEPAAFLPSFAESPTLASIEYLAFALGAVFALAAIPAISETVRAGNEGWVRWMSALAYLGFAVVALTFFQLLALVPGIASAFVAAESEVQPFIAKDFSLLGLDPQGWLTFGGVGLWVLVVSLLALRGNTWPTLLAVVGIAVAVLYGLVTAGNVLGIPELITIAAGLGGVILGPIWYIWIGARLFQQQPQPGPQSVAEAG